MTETIEFVRGIYAAFAAGDVPRFLGYLDPKIRWQEAEGFPLADKNPYVGIDALVAGVFGRLDTLWKPFEVQVGEFAGGGHVVTMFGRYRGKAAKSGKALDVQVAHTWWLEGGEKSGFRAVRFQQMVDTAAVQRSLA